MPNPLYNSMRAAQPGNNMTQMMQKFQQFQSTFTGDPKAQVQNLLNTGKMTQAQYNQLSQMAKQFQNILGK